MNQLLLKSLLDNEIDVYGATERLSIDLDTYEVMLKAFLEDKTMEELDKAIVDENWDTAFTAVHALKGVAGNLGFSNLFYSISTLVIIIRHNRIDELKTTLEVAKRNYKDIVNIINKYLNK